MGRWIAVAVMFLVACTEHGKGGGVCRDDGGRVVQKGQTIPAGDGCNSCTCTATGLACTDASCIDGGFFDGPMAVCGASGGCPSGPVCGGQCCQAGEKCVGGTCMCGSGSACTGGNFCASGGPISMDGCGSVCCGATGPCPALQ